MKKMIKAYQEVHLGGLMYSNGCLRKFIEELIALEQSGYSEIEFDVENDFYEGDYATMRCHVSGVREETDEEYNKRTIKRINNRIKKNLNN